MEQVKRMNEGSQFRRIIVSNVAVVRRITAIGSISGRVKKKISESAELPDFTASHHKLSLSARLERTLLSSDSRDI